jgi:membrane fusion protein, copper/silver efflux system
MKRILIITAVVIAVAAVAVFYATRNPIHDTQLYTCPMHPQVIQDHPGSCPICGMTLVKLEVRSPGSGVRNQNNALTDHAAVTISQEKQQLIGVKTDIVTKKKTSKTITTVGIVAYDPELYYAQQEYISSYKNMKQMQAAGELSGAGVSGNLLDSSKLKLKSLGLSDQQIKELELKAAPDKSLLATGDSGNAWVYAQVYQDDLPYISRGSAADILLASAGNMKFKGKIIGIDPFLDPETRTIKVRILTQNTSGMLKPEAYVDVKMTSASIDALAVPEEAIMDTGDRKMAFVDTGNGVFEPRLVTTAGTDNGYTVVTGGLKEGEEVVTNANFLIDSESRLKAR